MLDHDIKNLIEILEKSNIEEIEVSTFWGKQKICLRKNIRFNQVNSEIDSNKQTNITLDDKAKLDNIIEIENKTINDNILAVDGNETSINSNENNITIKAPLVGTFYISPKPDAPPFISEGETVEKGQIICIIEAMKIFNEIESDYSGKIIKILVDNSSPVEYDQDLIVISTK